MISIACRSCQIGQHRVKSWTHLQRLERGSLTVRSVEAWHWVQTHWILRLGQGLKLEKIVKLFETYGYCLQKKLPRLHIRWVQIVGLSTWTLKPLDAIEHYCNLWNADAVILIYVCCIMTLSICEINGSGGIYEIGIKMFLTTKMAILSYCYGWISVGRRAEEELMGQYIC